MPTKPWYLSKSVWNAVLIALLGVYDAIGPLQAWPAIPPIVYPAPQDRHDHDYQVKFGLRWLEKVGNLVGKVVDAVRAGLVVLKGKPKG